MSRRIYQRYLILSPNTFQTTVNEGILVAADKYKVDLRGQEVFHFDKKGKYFGNKAYRTKSSSTYQQHLKQLWVFLARIGDFESMLILVRINNQPLKGVPAMRESSVIAYLRYKKLEKDLALFDDDEAVMDIYSESQICCMGTWKSNKAMGQFKGCVSSLHIMNGHSSKYADTCPDCVELYEANDATSGCRIHAREGLRTFRGGNVACSVIVKTEIDNLSDPNYKMKGCTALNPKEIRAVRRYLLSVNILSNLADYVLALVASKVFLRSDEILPMQISHFLPALFQKRYGDPLPLALCVKVWGKKDKCWVYRDLYRDDECPDLCQVRHLLILIYMVDCSNGGDLGKYLFPSYYTQRRRGNTNQEQSQAESRLSYHSYSTQFKTILVNVFGEAVAVDKTLGLHMFRKTGYKLAILGKGEWAAIKIDARHRDEETAENYAGDSFGEINRAINLEDPEWKVSIYKPSKRDNPRSVDLDQYSPEETAEQLKTIARTYVQSLPGFRQGMTQREIIEAALQKPSENRAELLLRLQGFLGTEGNTLLTNFVRLNEERVTQLVRQEKEEKQELLNELNRLRNKRSAEEVEVADPEQERAQQPQSKRSKRQYGQDNLEGRLEIGKLGTVQEKVEKIVEVCETVDTSNLSGSLTSSAKTWYSRTKYVCLCLQNHFEGDVVEFSEAWGARFRLKFGAECCKGGGAKESCPGMA